MTGAAWMGWCLVMCLNLAPSAAGQGPEARPRAKVEFRWLASKPIKGVTEEKGIKTTCGDELSYLHKTPVLTNADVAEARMLRHDFRASNIGIIFEVEMELTADAKKRLAESLGTKERGVLAVLVDGKYCGAWYFQKSRMADFQPGAGFFSMQIEAERVVEACARASEP